MNRLINRTLSQKWSWVQEEAEEEQESPLAKWGLGFRPLPCQDLIPDQPGAALGSRWRGRAGEALGTCHGSPRSSQHRAGAKATLRVQGDGPGQPHRDGTGRRAPAAAAPRLPSGRQRHRIPGQGRGREIRSRSGAARGGGGERGRTARQCYLCRPWHARNPRGTFYSLISLPNWNSWCWQFPPRPRGPRSHRTAFGRCSARKDTKTKIKHTVRKGKKSRKKHGSCTTVW